MRPAGLSGLVRRTYRLLKRTQPMEGQYDVEWWGPYYIPRRGEWLATRFTLYNGTLYGRIHDSTVGMGLSWHLATGQVERQRGLGTGGYAEVQEWAKALAQIERRLESALANISRYNANVSRRLLMACRHGRIQRGLTWPKQVKAAIPLTRINRAKRVLREAASRPWLTEMTKRRYLETAAIAYDACFKELRPFSALEKYRKKADDRHGGLLDLPDEDPEAFSKWYQSSSWAGTHPWEIIFGHPHGIMLSPRLHEDKARWSYWLWVDSLGWYASAANMAIALGEREVPFEFQDGAAVLDALQGWDEVEVGPSFEQVEYEELRKQRPDALKLIRWDPIPEQQPITTDQGVRVMNAKKELRSADRH